jgi:hypothetical protein
MRLWCFLLLAGLASCAGETRSTGDAESTRKAQGEAMAARGTAEGLASASLVSSFKRNPESLVLINRAAALAPHRPEIIYLQWRVCVFLQCGNEAQIVADLKKADPGNGLAWLPELTAAVDRADQNGVTDIAAQIGTTQGLKIYWNSLVVMLVDSLGEAAVGARPRSDDLPTRMTTAIGTLAAVAIPPLRALSASCHADQFGRPGRRAACEAMMSRLSRSDTAIMQSIGLSIQERWWPDGSPERDRLQAERRQLYYVMDAASRPRIFRQNEEWAIRLDALRKTQTETAADQAMLISYHEPLERPLNWKDPYSRSE